MSLGTVSGGITASAAPAPSSVFTSLKSDGAYLYGVPRGTGAADLKFAFGSQTVSVKSASGSVLGDNDQVATGCTVGGSSGISTVVIAGDVDGTGDISTTDYVSVKSHFKGVAVLSGAYLKAADVNGDSKITVTDYLMIKRQIAGTYNFDKKVTVGKEIASGAQKWINTIKDSSVIMTEAQIKSHNNTIRSKNPDWMRDLANYPSSLSSSALSSYIEDATKTPTGKYNANKQAITSSMITSYKNNRNMSGIASSNPTKKGIVVRRSMLRSLPTLTAFYDTTSGKLFGNFDRIQETGLSVGFPVYVLHTSSDGNWYFVESYFYQGWVQIEDIALCSNDSSWSEYYDPSDYAVITDPLLNISGKKLDMSTRLPLVKENSFSYTVKLPSRNSSGYLVNETVSISKASAHHGYLPYTKENVYNQAFKYTGTGYGWGDMVDGVDCTSYAANVFRCFGFMFPRNGDEQSGSVGTTIKSLSGTDSAKYSTLASYSGPFLVYTSGHCMIYLGVMNGTHYIIHANASTMNVAETNMSNRIGDLFCMHVIG